MLYLVGKKAGAPVSVALLVQHMKINMRVRPPPPTAPPLPPFLPLAASHPIHSPRHPSSLRRSSSQDFFQVVEDVWTRLYPGKPCGELQQLKENFVSMTVMFKKWEQCFARYFPNGFVGVPSLGDDPIDLKRVSFELGWTLFLLAKTHANAHLCLRLGDIAKTYPLLVGVVHLLLAHIPAAAKTAGSFWQALAADVAPECYPFPAHALETLCGQMQPLIKRDDLASQTQPTFAVVEPRLGQVLQLSTPTAARGDGGGDGGGRGFAGLLQSDNLVAARDALSAEYARVWAQPGSTHGAPSSQHLDGRLFLSEQAPPRFRAATGSSVPASPAVARARATSSSSASGSSLPQPPPLLTPIRQANPLTSRSGGGGAGGVPQTPISSGLECAGWLEAHVKRLPATPSPELDGFFAACADNPSKAVLERLDAHCRTVAAHLSTSKDTAHLSGGDVDELVSLTRKLYFKMLLAFLQTEQARRKTAPPLGGVPPPAALTVT